MTCRLFKFFFCLLLVPALHAQKAKVDSQYVLLKQASSDTARVKLMWQIARDMNKYNPDSALRIAQEALILAENIQDVEGQSRSLGILANTFMIIGNFPRALELNIRKLKLEEQRKNPRSLASVLMNIGIVYVGQEEYIPALDYYRQADSVIRQSNVEDFQYNIALNLGDVFYKMSVIDSAFYYFQKAHDIAMQKKGAGEEGNALTGLAHCYAKMGANDRAAGAYREAIHLLMIANDEEVLCEAALGFANVFRQQKNYDSAFFYANVSLEIAKKDRFLAQELKAAQFLTAHFQETRNIDKAFRYTTYVMALNDSVNSRSKVRESQVISSNERFRQMELDAERRMAQKKRIQQLQLLLIAIFIPILFLITLLLSRVRIHTRFIRLLGVLSLLFLFEYLTLLLHPTVANLTHHSPVLDILIFVVVAAILIPLHHRMEHWLIHKLNHIRAHHEAKKKMKSVIANKKPGAN